MHSKMNNFAANSSSAILLLLVAGAATIVSATYPRFRAQVNEDGDKQLPNASPDKVKTLFYVSSLTNGNRALKVMRPSISNFHK